MAGSDDETTPPGWYRQKDDPTILRWWDGEGWTDDTMPVPDEVARRTSEKYQDAYRALSGRSLSSASA